jgi:hypothetical protein
VVLFEIFRHHAPSLYLEELAQMLPNAYLQANAALQGLDLDEPESKNLYPLLRREFIETNFRRVSEKHGFTCRTQRNGFFFHLEVDIGPFVLTVSKDDNDFSPEEAVYKRNLALKQLLLPFVEYDNESWLKNPRTSYYAMLLHEPRKDRTGPKSMMIRFPKANLDEFHEGEIDLHYFTKSPVLDTEVITDSVNPVLRRKLATGN